MKRKLMFITMIAAGVSFFASCNDAGKVKSSETTSTSAPAETTTPSASEGSNPKGIGPHQDVQLTHPLDEAMVTKGKNISDVKCTSCHKLSDEKLVGPGWKGVTDRRTPEFIMNFITNTEEMLEKDTAVQNMLEVCLVKMPNQGLTEADARSVLEYMRKIDGKN
jgi:mono/diheme cytochrome c family protein